MLYGGIARAVDTNYQTFDFFSWQQTGVSSELIGLVNRSIAVPRVILLQTFDKLPMRNMKFSRNNIFLRDDFTCQYCCQKFPRAELNFDHVLPRSRGGKTSWENVVTSCYACNYRKGDFLPFEAGMPLLKKPKKPNAIPFLTGLKMQSLYEQWNPFLRLHL